MRFKLLVILFAILTSLIVFASTAMAGPAMPPVTNGTLAFNATIFDAHGYGAIGIILNVSGMVRVNGANVSAYPAVDQIILNLSTTTSNKTGGGPGGNGTTYILIYLNESNNSIPINQPVRAGDTGIFDTIVNASTGAETRINLTPGGFTIDGVDTSHPYWINLSGGDIINITTNGSNDNTSVDGQGVVTNFNNGSYLTFADAKGAVISVTTTAGNTVGFHNGETFNISITDFGNNTNTQAIDNITIEIFSNVAGTTVGMNVTLNESGVNTAVFNIILNNSRVMVPAYTVVGGTIVFGNTTNVTIPGVLGSTINVSYVDRRNQSTGGNWSISFPANITNGALQYVNVYFDSNATVSLNHTLNYTLTGLTGGLDHIAGLSLTSGAINITDPGNNTNSNKIDQIKVNISSWTHTNEIFDGGVMVTLNETGLNTGIFAVFAGNSSAGAGRINFTESGSSGTTNESFYTLKVNETGKIVIRYADYNENKTAYTGADNASVYMSAALSLSKGVYIFTDNLSIILRDWDLNLNPNTIDNVTINLTSTFDSLGGTNVTLNETGANTGIFDIVVYGRGGSNATRINFTSGPSINASSVILNYSLKVNRNGSDQLMASYADSQPLARRFAYARMDQALATVSFNKTGYGTNFSVNSAMKIVVADMGRNTNASTNQTLTVTLTSTSDGTGITVTLNETETEGVFINSRRINLSTNNSDTADLRLKVAAGDNLTVSYDDPENFTGGNPAAITANANVFNKGAIKFVGYNLSEDVEYYNISASPGGMQPTNFNLTVTDYDANLDRDKLDQVSINVTTTTNRSGIEFRLNETGVNTGVFSIPWNITPNGGGTAGVFSLNISDTMESDNSSVNAAQGDTIRATYRDVNGSVDGNSINVSNATVRSIRVTLTTGPTGWDLFSVPFPLKSGRTTVESVFGDVTVNKSGSTYTIFTWNGTSYGNSLTGSDTLSALRGYWVLMTSEDNITMVTPKHPALDPDATFGDVDTLTRSLGTGWHMVGVNYVTNNPAGFVLNGLNTSNGAAAWINLREYDTDPSTGTAGTTATTLNAGSAYWLFMTEADTLPGLALR